MRRIGGLWPSVVDIGNLRQAAKMACRSRKNRDEVAEFQEDSERMILELQASLMDGTYRSSEYRMFTVNERGKERLVADLSLYPDRILHWAICLVVEAPLNSKLIDQTYGSRPGTGYHQAVMNLSRYMEGDTRIRYALLMDIRHFFPSIDKGILKQKLRQVLKDAHLLGLLDVVIDDYKLPGIPIGNRTSPMFANLYLSELDHAMKERYHCHYYVRYMDDMVVLGYSKPWLHRIRKVIDGMLSDVGLEMKSNWQVFPVESRGVPFLGYRVFPDHILIRKSTKERMKKAAGRIAWEQTTDPTYVMGPHDKGVVDSYKGALAWCNGKNLRKRYLDPLVKENKARIDKRRQDI